MREIVQWKVKIRVIRSCSREFCFVHKEKGRDLCIFSKNASAQGKFLEISGRRALNNDIYGVARNLEVASELDRRLPSTTAIAADWTILLSVSRC